MADVFRNRMAIGHQLADTGTDEHKHDRYARHAQGVADQGDDAEVSPGFAGAEEHPGAEHRRDQGGDTDVERSMVARSGVVFNALTTATPGIGQAQDEEHRACDNQRDDPYRGIQHNQPPDFFEWVNGGGCRKKKNRQALKLWRHVKDDSNFLRRHYPDQVLRSAAFFGRPLSLA